MPAPNTPTTFLVQQSDATAVLSWDQMLSPLATSYLVQRSLDNITYATIATITGSPLVNNFVDSDAIDPNKAQINISSSNVLTLGQTYVITSVGTTTMTQWQAVGLRSGITPAVGMIFTAIITGSGTGTGTVQNGVTVGSQYYYQVAAMNGSGTSSYTTPQAVIICLPGQECLGNMRLYAQQRADRVNSQFVTTTEWNRYLSESVKELYDILIQKFGDDYYVATPYCFITSGVDQLYPLPDGVNYVSALAPDQKPAAAFYKSLLVEVALNPNDPNSWVSLREYQRVQQNLWNFPNVYTFRGVTNLRYRYTGNSIQLVPQTQANQYVRIWYAPRRKALLLDTDMVDGISGWEQYPIVDAARKALLKEESDTMGLDQEKAMLLQRIEEAAENRNIGEPETVSDSKMRNLAWSDDSGYGGGSGYF